MRLAHRLVLCLIALQVVATATVWNLNPTDSASQAAFATLLAIDLLALAMVSYLYRSEKAGKAFSRPWILGGCGMFVVLWAALLLGA
jgi:hypothetical protein